jgi:hypothetical protein
VDQSGQSGWKNCNLIKFGRQQFRSIHCKNLLKLGHEVKRSASVS